MQSPLIQHVNPRLILASSSIYRQALLARLCLAFDIITPDVAEELRCNETPAAMAARLAVEKATAVARKEPQALVIGSDQVAALDGKTIGKPGSHEKAMAQLRTMRGRTVVFYTAVCLIDGRSTFEAPGCAGKVQQATIETIVKFRELPDDALDAYLRIEKPYDCAGSAKNEGLGIVLIESCNSNDPTALTGLPLIALSEMLLNAGVVFFAAGDA
ncbi:MAG: Maf family nucleotide pyrophosphatase [Pseudomonadota bacterium]